MVVPTGVDALGGGEGDLARSLWIGVGVCFHRSPRGCVRTLFLGLSQAVRLGAPLGFRAYLPSWLPWCFVGRSAGVAPFRVSIFR